MKSLGV